MTHEALLLLLLLLLLHFANTFCSVGWSVANEDINYSSLVARSILYDYWPPSQHCSATDDGRRATLNYK
jgi:hypothetical protein